MSELTRAREGDQDAFAALVAPYRHELQVHCYRVLGSLQDAEEALQETLLAAWQGLRGFEERSSTRTWLYRIATNRCLDQLRASRRRTPMGTPLPVQPPEPSSKSEVAWLQPYPDDLLDLAPGPEQVAETREATSLAFVRALQLLPPRQRVVLVLRDVLPARTAGSAPTPATSCSGAVKQPRWRRPPRLIHVACSPDTAATPGRDTRGKGLP